MPRPAHLQLPFQKRQKLPVGNAKERLQGRSLGIPTRHRPLRQRAQRAHISVHGAAWHQGGRHVIGHHQEDIPAQAEQLQNSPKQKKEEKYSDLKPVFVLIMVLFDLFDYELYISSRHHRH